jgi:hypothetical protein
MFGGAKIITVVSYYNNRVWYPSVNGESNIYYYGWYFNETVGSGHLLTCGLI